MLVLTCSKNAQVGTFLVIKHAKDMKVILEFTDEEKAQRNMALYGSDFWLALWEIQQHIRSYRKYHEGCSADELKAAKETIRNIESELNDIAWLIESCA